MTAVIDSFCVEMFSEILFKWAYSESEGELKATSGMSSCLTWPSGWNKENVAASTCFVQSSAPVQFAHFESVSILISLQEIEMQIDAALAFAFRA